MDRLAEEYSEEQFQKIAEFAEEGDIVCCATVLVREDSDSLISLNATQDLTEEQINALIEALYEAAGESKSILNGPPINKDMLN